MGMPVAVEVREGELAAGALDRVFAWLRFVDATFSPYKPDSEVCRIDGGELAPADAHPLVREVMARCERLRALTGGYFDARARGPLDPSGLVKGWSVDRAGGLLRPPRAGPARPRGARQGGVGRPRGGAARRGGGAALLHRGGGRRAGAGRAGARGRAPPAPPRPPRRGALAHRRGGGDLGRL